jgi:thioredoxin-like negative regulator of GroEL
MTQIKVRPPMPDINATKPDALLLLTASCPYCPTVLAALSDLVKAGHIGRLEVVNIGVRPEVAQQHGVRSVPWVKLGPFELDGLRSPAELRQWAERAGSPAGLGDYFTELLKGGQLAKVTAHVRRDPGALAGLLGLLDDPDIELTVRIGISAVFEELEGDAALHDTLDTLTRLTRHADAHIRADAAHMLSLTHRPEAAPHLQALLNDGIADVRDIAREGLDRLGGKHGN